MRELILSALLFGGLQTHAAGLQGDLYCRFQSGDLKGYLYDDRLQVIQVLELPGRALNENPVPVTTAKSGELEFSMSNMSREADAGKTYKVVLPDNAQIGHFGAELYGLAADEAGPYPLPREIGDCTLW